LHRFIHSSQSVVRAGDPAAKSLFERYGRQVMPDHPLSDAEIDTLLAYIEAGGPGAGEAPVRKASAATEAEVHRGRALFLGRAALANGGAACVHCHAAGDADPVSAGGFAPDLTRAYFKYKDWGLVQALERPQLQLPVMEDLYGAHPLTPDEAFVLSAFLYRTAQHAPALPVESSSPARTAAFLGFGGSALVFWWTGRRRGGK
jgi:ubiquinol-cytochrome c reductase cytochrome c subunit